MNLFIKNIYLHKVNALKPLFDLVAQVDPQDITQWFGAREVLHDLRDLLVRQYSWAVPSTAAVQIMARYSPIVEVGAGTGYWSYLLRLAGADVIAYDIGGPVRPLAVDMHTEVLKGTVQEAVKQHPERTLLLCWPPALRLTDANHVVFVGWKDDDMTGCLDFHSLLRREWKLVVEESIPQWPEMRDRLFVYRRAC